jgi:hypothetical protein
MTRDTDLIGLIEGYLDDFEGHTPLPDATRDAIRARLPSTMQRPAWWPGWRFLGMNTAIKYVLGAAAAVLVAIVGLTVLNGGNVGAAPEPTEFPDSGFTSERHHYALLFPDDSWLITEREGLWAPGTVFGEASQGIDVADRVGESQPWILLASQPLDVEPEAWLARYDSLLESSFPQCAVDSSENRTVDGEEARITRYGCDGGGDGVEATMFHGDRVYAVRVFDGDDQSYDPRPLLDEFLAVFRFRD